ncbi:kelch-like protein 38 isoform X1 [Lampetra planeri]
MEAQPPLASPTSPASLITDICNVSTDDSCHGCPETFIFRSSSPALELLPQMNEFRLQGILTDISLHCGAAEFRCHRVVLAACCPYFRAMFSHGFREGLEDSVRLGSVPARTLASLLDFAYTGEVSISEENVGELLQAASMLHFREVEGACCSFLERQLSPQNCLSLMALADTFGCPGLCGRARAMALSRFREVAESGAALALTGEELARYLEDDQLCADEETVFQTIVAWVRHDPGSRLQHLERLFMKVRLEYVDPQFLAVFVARDQLVRASPPCRARADNAVAKLTSPQYHQRHNNCHNSEDDSSSSSSSSSPPGCSSPPPRHCFLREHLVILGGRADGARTTRSVLLLETATLEEQPLTSWLSLPKLPGRYRQPSAATLHGAVYVTGGIRVGPGASLGAPCTDVHRYSPRAAAWKPAPPLLAPRYGHQSVAVGSRLYVLGGVGGGGGASGEAALLSVERYESTEGEWRWAAPMPVAVGQPAVAAVQGRIYVIGGEELRSKTPARIIQIYNTECDAWFRLETRMVKNISAPAVVVDDKIIVIGGYTRRVLSYDPASNRFSRLADLRERRAHHAACVLDGRVLVSGGRAITPTPSVVDSDSLELYDPAVDAWAPAGRLPYRLFHHSCVTLRSPLLLFDGAT